MEHDATQGAAERGSVRAWAADPDGNLLESIAAATLCPIEWLADGDDPGGETRVRTRRLTREQADGRKAPAPGTRAVPLAKVRADFDRVAARLAAAERAAAAARADFQRQAALLVAHLTGKAAGGGVE